MKLKLDENLPAGLVEDLHALGHDVDTVPSEALHGLPDSDVWSAAEVTGRMLVTQDLDFSDLRGFAPGTHCGLVIIRIREPGRLALRARIAQGLPGRKPRSGAASTRSGNPWHLLRRPSTV